MRWLALTAIGLLATACGARTELDLEVADAGRVSTGSTSGGSTSGGRSSGCPVGSPVVSEGGSCNAWGEGTSCPVTVDACGNGKLMNEVCECTGGAIRCPRPPAGSCPPVPAMCGSVADDPLQGCPGACPTGTLCVTRSQSGGVGFVGCFPIPGACAADPTCECLACLCGGRVCAQASDQPPAIFCL